MSCNRGDQAFVMETDPRPSKRPGVLVKAGVTAAAAVALLSLTRDAVPQRHLPDVQIVRTATALYLDTRVEEPAVYTGHGRAVFPKAGETVEFQLFVPSAAGKMGFECSIAFEDPDGAFSGGFRILSAVDWSGKDLQPLPGTRGTVRANSRVSFAPVPYSGHVATVTLEPREGRVEGPPLRVRLSVTVVSIPPRRVWQMDGQQTLHWL